MLQKKELAALQSELKRRMRLLSDHRDQVEKIDNELVEIVDKQLALSDLDNFGKSRNELESLKQTLTQRTQEQMQEIMKKKQSLKLNLKRIVLDNNNSTESTSTSYYPSSYDTSFKDAQSPLKTNDTYHTAASSCSDLNCNERVQNIMCDSGVDLEQNHRNKEKSSLNMQVDESDLSSSEDYKMQSDENSVHSSSSIERVPFPLKRRVRSKPNLRYCGKDAMNDLKYYRQAIANQKMLIMQGLENDCNKEDINKHISVSRVRKC